MTNTEQVKIPKGYKQTEVGVIPEDWIVRCVGDSCDLLTGYPFPSASYSGHGIRLLRGSNVKRGCTDWSDGITQYWPEITADIKQYELCDGDIVISMDGSLVGRSFAQLTQNDLPALLLQRVARLRSTSVSVGFLKEWVCSKFFTDHCDSVKTVTAIPHISPEDIRTFKFLCPPSVEEQTAIANALSDVDNLIAALETLITKKSAIKTAAMQQLLTGKKRLPGFAKQNTNTEQTAQTTQALQTDKNSDAANSNNSQAATSLGYKHTELGEIPEDWGVVTLGSIAGFYKGKGLPKSELSLDGAYKCIHYGELFTHYAEEIKSIKSRTDLSGNTFISKANDILMPTSDVTPNGLATASGIKMADIILGGDVLVIRPKEGALDSTYFAYVIGISKDQVMQLVSGSTVYHLYGSDMATFKYRAPKSLKEQTAIANVLSDMDTELDALQQRLSKTKKIKQGMMQELLTGRTRLVNGKG